MILMLELEELNRWRAVVVRWPEPTDWPFPLYCNLHQYQLKGVIQKQVGRIGISDTRREGGE